MTLPTLSAVSPHAPQTGRVAEPSFAELASQHPDAARAAQQFEAVFLKQMLASLEKVTSLDGGSQTQTAVVGSMMTSALSDQMSTAGGIGLSEVILRAMIAQEPNTAAGTPPKASHPAVEPGEKAEETPSVI